MKRLKRWISSLLTLCMVISLFPMPIQAEAMETQSEYPVILADEPTTVEITSGGEYSYFSFTPEYTESYTFYSVGSNDTYGYLYDSNMSLLAYNDDGGENTNFSITYTLEAGVTYIWASRFYSSGTIGNIEVILQTNHSGEGVVTKPATCTDDGVMTYTCTVCGLKYTEVIAGGHDFDEDGLCSVCSYDSLYPITGICGDAAYWSLSRDGILTISGEGEMHGFDADAEYRDPAPWLEYQNEVNQVVIEPGISNISEEAFAYCESMQSITIANTVVSMGAYAFEHCSQLTEVHIPESVEEISTSAPFLGCTQIKKYAVDPKNEYYSNDEYGVLFDKEQTILLSAPSTISGEYELPQSVTEISGYAFYKCEKLTKLIFPEGLQTLRSDAVVYCASLTEVNLPNSLRRWLDGAFRGCCNLRNITIDSSNRYFYLGDNAVVYTKDKTQPVFGPGASGELMLLDTVTRIPQYTFDGCTNITKVDIPDGVTSIESGAFENCDSLVSVSIPDSIEGIGWWAFSGCNSLTDISLPQTLEIISHALFSHCENLVNVPIHDRITTIEDYAFAYCPSIQKVEFPASVTYIGEDAFRNCDNLSTLMFAGNAPEIGDFAFGHIHAKAYYPANDETWTEAVRQNYGGSIEWISYTDECEHIYESVVTAPSCEDQGYTTHTCSACGDSYVDGYVDATGHSWDNDCDTECNNGCGATRTTGHSYTSAVTSPTCTEQGYTTHTCSVCGDSYVDGYVGETGHAWDNDCDTDCNSCGYSRNTTHDYDAEGLCIKCGQEKYSVTGICGDNLTWSLTKDGTLTISGSGPMYDYQESNSASRPWNDYREKIISVAFEGNITSIGEYAFAYCSNLANIDIPDSVSRIGKRAFMYCGLTNVTIPGSVHIIEEHTFNYCSNLDTVNFLDGVVSIEKYVFYYSSIDNVIIPKSVTNIANDAFYEASPDEVYYVGTEEEWNQIEVRDYWLDYITNIHFIADEMVAIGECCGNLKWLLDRSGTLTISGQGDMEEHYDTSRPTWFDYAYGSKIKNVIIEDGVTSIGLGTFFLTRELVSVTIPQSVTYIGYYAFDSCEKLKDIYYDGTKEQWDAITIEDINEELFNATIHYLGGSGIPENADVRYFHSWDAENQVAHWGDDSFGIGSQVTDETDTSFLEIVDSLVGHYVLVETKDRDDSMIDHNYLISIKPVETKSGTVTANEGRSIWIDDVEYALSEKFGFVMWEAGDLVTYHLYNGELVGIQEYDPDATNPDLPDEPEEPTEPEPDSGYQLVITPADETITGEVGESLEINCALYNGDKLVTDWEQPQFAMSNLSGSKPISYESWRKEENGSYTCSLICVSAGTVNLTIQDNVSSTVVEITIEVVPMKTDSIRNLSIKYMDDLEEKEKTAQVRWGYSLFREDARDIENSDPASFSELVKISALLSKTSYDVSSGGHLQQALKQLGAQNISVINSEKWDISNPAHSISHIEFKEVELQHNIIVVTIRGSTTPGDWVTDFLAWAGDFWESPKEHPGFAIAKSAIKNEIERYLLENEIKASEAKILITGHSYGAAVANLLAKSLEDIFDQSDIYAYTFAAPNNIVVNPSFVLEYQSESNIHNFRNAWDPVVRVPAAPALLEVYTVWGEQHFFTLEEIGDNSEGADLFGNHNGTHYVNYALNLAKHNTVDSLQTRCVQIHCPVDVTAYDKNGNIVGRITDNQLAVASENIMMFPVSDQKHIFIDQNDEVQLSIVATDSGDMDVIITDYDVVTGEISAIKKYSEIGLKEGKDFYTSISDDTTTEDIILEVVDNEGNRLAIVSEDGTETVDISEKHKHITEIQNTKEATCTETGYSGDEICGECSTVVKQGKVIPTVPHEYELTITDPTCIERGYTTYFCHCGDTFISDEVAALGHSFTNYVSNEDATCESDGTKTAKCDRCEATDTVVDEGSATGHIYEAVVTAPTCKDGGYTTYTCECGDTYVGDEVAALGHSFTNYISNSDATCETDGTKTAKCDRCDATDTVTDEGSAIGHNYTSEVTAESTCEDKGLKTFSCICGDSYTEEIPAKGHTLTQVEAKAPTCTEAGYEAYEYCSVCDYTTYKEVPAKGHTYEAVVTAPTCEEKGYTTYTCACGDSYIDDEVAALGHNKVTDKGYDATCTKTGLTDGKHCGRCNKILVAQIITPVLGHDWDAGTITKEPTRNEAGIKTYTCVRCDMTKTEEIPCLTLEITRIAGSGRVQTAIAAADVLKEKLGVEKFDSIILASGGNFADALAGSYLANAKGAPILLYYGKNSITENLAYIQVNLADNGKVYILGGSAAVPEAVESALNDAGIQTERLQGNNRFETNMKILAAAGVADREILICTGWNYADCLSASATGLPILMVNTTSNKLTEDQIDFLTEHKDNAFTVIGGTGAVSEALENAIEAIVGEVDRISGICREETSAAIAERYFEDSECVFIAFSRNFPDGLCGGPVAYAYGAPLLLVNKNQEHYAAEYINVLGIAKGYVLGGTAVVSEDVVQTVFVLSE